MLARRAIDTERLVDRGLRAGVVKTTVSLILVDPVIVGAMWAFSVVSSGLFRAIISWRTSCAVSLADV